MKRRSFLAGAAAGSAIGVLDWLGWFRSFGVPGTAKSLGIAEAVAQAAATPRFLIYWFQEGGWDSYSMFGPLATPQHATTAYAAGTLHPSPEWSNQFYRPVNYLLDATHQAPTTTGNITHGYLAADAGSLLNDLAVVSSHDGSTFHSGSRWEYHYGKYSTYAALSAKRGTDERSVLHAFCEAYGQSYPLAHVAWHRWLSDGELSEPTYPEGTGYYEKLGPAWGHTTYGRTPVEMRNRLQSLTGVTAGAKAARIRTFVDDLHNNFIKDHNSESVKAFDSAVKIHRQLTGGVQVVVDPNTMFTDPTLRAEFGVAAADETTNATSVNGNPARSKDSPMTNVQALMTYELMTKGLSCGFWIENRQIRGFDTHRDRKAILNAKGQNDQLNSMKRDLWKPLNALVNRLKTTQLGTTGKSFWDSTTIVLCSEMGRTMQGDVTDILAKSEDDAAKYTEIMDQDCCQHWKVSSAAFLGGTVKPNVQYGKVGTTTLRGIPLDPNTGALDPAFDPVTGVQKAGTTPNPNCVVSDAGHVYSTALYLSGLDPAALKTAGKGRNNRPPLKFVAK
ncbi:MAG: DUF1501 domain-containing protein [Myxococcaceae bacterium]|nr:DUF1501 domain-containing protein [Myxococcaceae bacterium]